MIIYPSTLVNSISVVYRVFYCIVNVFPVI